MKVSCPSCQTNYNIDDKRIPPGGAKLKCARCQNTFPIKPGDGVATPVALPRRGLPLPRLRPPFRCRVPPLPRLRPPFRCRVPPLPRTRPPFRCPAPPLPRLRPPSRCPAPPLPRPIRSGPSTIRTPLVTSRSPRASSPSPRCPRRPSGTRATQAPASEGYDPNPHEVPSTARDFDFSDSEPPPAAASYDQGQSDAFSADPFSSYDQGQQAQAAIPLPGAAYPAPQDTTITQPMPAYAQAAIPLPGAAEDPFALPPPPAYDDSAYAQVSAPPQEDPFALPPPPAAPQEADPFALPQRGGPVRPAAASRRAPGRRLRAASAARLDGAAPDGRSLRAAPPQDFSLRLRHPPSEPDPFAVDLSDPPPAAPAPSYSLDFNEPPQQAAPPAPPQRRRPRPTSAPTSVT